MPHPGQKSVTLPAALVERAAGAAGAAGIPTSQFIAQALERALARDLLVAGGSGSPSPQSAPVSPVAVSGGVQAAPGEAPSVPSPLPASGVHPADVARGAGDARPAVAVASSARASGQSPRLEPHQGIPPTAAPHDEPGAHGTPEVPPAVATDPTTARGVPPVSTWTCPRCRVEIPLAERIGHHCAPRVEPKPAPVAAATVAHKPAARQPDVDQVVRFVKMFLAGAKDAVDRRAYLAAAVQAAHRDQGFAISDAEALELVAALATREPAIERALEPPTELGPPGPPSRSTTSPVRKGGARGRT